MDYRLIKDLDDKQHQKLTDLIHMKSPEWMNLESAQKTLSVWDESREEVIEDLIGILDLNYGINFRNGPSAHPRFKSVEGYVKASQYLDLWNSGRIISTSEAQDAKDLIQKTFNDAQSHATNHWNNQWIQPGHLNIEKWYLSDGSSMWVVQPVDFEHRLWGIVGFLLGIVPLGPNARPWNGIEVAGLFINEISRKTEKSVQEVTTKFDLSYHKCVMLPMMNTKDKCDYFTDINTHSAKTDLQFAHSITHDLNNAIKKTTSIKVNNDNSNDNKLNSFSNTFTDSEKYSLRPYEYGIGIWKFMDNDYKFCSMSKAKLRGFIEKNENYSVNKDDEIEFNNNFEILFNATKYKHLKFSLQKGILFIKMLKDLEENDFYTICLKTFSKDFAEWIEEESYEIKNVDGVDEEVKTGFSGELDRANTKEHYITLYKRIKKDFLKYNDEKVLNEMGIVSKPQKLPRSWSPENRNRNLKLWENKDPDGKIISMYDNTHFGHLVSDFELSRLTDEERKEVFKEENEALKKYGYRTITGHENNYRVISERHNYRQGIMRMSDYHNILDTTDDTDEQDELIKKKLKEYEEKYKDKPILS
jgi:hypothetical protein